MQGTKITDKVELRRQNINPRAVGLALVKLFAEMTLIHGYVHGDPHPGNLMVRPKGETGKMMRMYGGIGGVCGGIGGVCGEVGQMLSRSSPGGVSFSPMCGGLFASVNSPQCPYYAHRPVPQAIDPSGTGCSGGADSLLRL